MNYPAASYGVSTAFYKKGIAASCGELTPKEIKYLIKMTIAKHEYGAKKPGIKLVNKIKDNGVPTRLVE